MSLRFFGKLLYGTFCLGLAVSVIVIAIRPPEVLQPTVSVSAGHNVENPMDVNGDGFAGAHDVKILLDTLRRHRHELPLSMDEFKGTHPFIDVDGDGYLSKEDAQPLILHVNHIKVSTRRVAYSPPADPSEMQTSSSFDQR